MVLRWGGDAPFDPGAVAALRTLPRQQATQAHERLMGPRSVPSGALGALPAENGEAIDGSDAGLLRTERAAGRPSGRRQG